MNHFKVLPVFKVTRGEIASEKSKKQRRGLPEGI